MKAADARPPSDRELAELIIAFQLDLPSVYMGGPSAPSRRRAREVLAQLESQGFEVVYRSDRGRRR